MSNIPELIAQNKQILTQLIALTKKEDKDILSQVESLSQKATKSMKQLTCLPAEELKPYKNDYIGLVALLDQATTLLQNSQNETRQNITRMMQQMKAQKGYTK